MIVRARLYSDAMSYTIYIGVRTCIADVIQPRVCMNHEVFLNVNNYCFKGFFISVVSITINAGRGVKTGLGIYDFLFFYISMNIFEQCIFTLSSIEKCFCWKTIEKQYWDVNTYRFIHFVNAMRLFFYINATTDKLNSFAIRFISWFNWDTTRALKKYYRQVFHQYSYWSCYLSNNDSYIIVNHLQSLIYILWVINSGIALNAAVCLNNHIFLWGS